VRNVRLVSYLILLLSQGRIFKHILLTHFYATLHPLAFDTGENDIFQKQHDRDFCQLWKYTCTSLLNVSVL
jgi:hypothetical protein